MLPRCYTPPVNGRAGGLTAAALLLAGTTGLVAYRTGPLPAMTGGFGEPTCHQCHFDSPVNDRAGALALEGVPETSEPSREYPITIVVRRPAIARAGFELAVRYAEGPHAGEQAGRLRAADERTQVISAPGSSVLYIQHTAAGSETTSPGEGRWTVFWTAPAQPAGAVVLHAAANAANGDESPLGDFVYTAEQRVGADVRRPD